MKKSKKIKLDVQEKAKFCPDCGEMLYLVIEDNEEDFYVDCPYLIYGKINRAGKKFDANTGKRMYRTEWHCPTKKSTIFPWNKEKAESHYILLGKTNLTN